MDRARPRAAVSVSPEPTFAGIVREVYKVNAQYRGAVTKGFDGVGEVTITHRPGSATAFGLELVATLRDPKGKKKDAHFEAKLRYTLEGSRIVPVSDQSEFSPEAQKHREKILQNGPFIYLVRHLPYPEKLPAEVGYEVSGKPYRIRYARSNRQVEATVFEGSRWIGKFFMAKGDGLPHDYEKFRVSTKGDTVISFVLHRRDPE